MVRIINILKYIVFLFGIHSMTFGQEVVFDHTSISIVHKYHGDSLMIRLLPINENILPILLKYGFDIERIETKNGKIDFSREFKKINTGKVRHFERNKFPSTTDDNLEIIKNILYPEKDLIEIIQGEQNIKTYQNYLSTINMGVNVIGSQNLEYSRLLGMYYVDTNIKKGSEYLYRISITDENNDKVFETYFPFYGEDQSIKNVEFSNVLESNNKVQLFWNYGELLKYYFLYHIERSNDNVNFERITKQPILPFTSENPILMTDFGNYTDTVNNYVPYFYRLVGIDYFGQISLPSKVIRAQGKDDIAPEAPVINYCESYVDSIMIVGWSKTEIETDMVGYNIYKGITYDGPFYKLNKKLINSTDTIFMDSLFKNNTVPYYRVCAIDSSGNEACGFPLIANYIDTISPISPKLLTYDIDTLGRLIIRWEYNKEKDMLGYYLYKSNYRDDDFVRITGHPIEDNFYNDTISLKTLTNKVFYKITAIDNSGNISHYSSILQVKIPDTIPPTQCILTSLKADSSFVSLRWISSSMNDIEYQIIERTIAKENNWQEIKRLPKGSETYDDDTVIDGKSYTYRILSQDYDHNISIPSNEFSIKVVLKKIDEIRIEGQRVDENSIKISWAPAFENAKQVIIYRGVSNGSLKSYKRISSDSLSFTDAVAKGASYKYAIRLQNINSTTSDFSNILIIK